MKVRISIVAFLYLSLIFYACRRDPNDNVSKQTIYGKVYNLSTDSGLSNTKVYLDITGPNGSSSLSALSGVNGSFSFPDVQVHSSSDYSYALKVPSNGAGGYEPAINGTTLALDKSNLNQSQILYVIPRFKEWYLYFPNTLFTSQDTFILTLTQNTIHKNLPSYNYQSISNCPCPLSTPTNSLAALADYWTGWWQVTLDKTKNGIQTLNTDSFYLGWGATVTDTIPW